MVCSSRRFAATELLDSFFYNLHCRSGESLIYNRSGFLMGRHEDPHHTTWMKIKLALSTAFLLT